MPHATSTPAETDTLPALYSTYDFLEYPFQNVTKRKAEIQNKRQQKTDLALYDIQFYPFAPKSARPVFAVTGDNHVIVGRISANEDKAVEVLRWFNDDDVETSFNSLCWTYDSVTCHPLLCVSGNKPVIKIFDIVDGKLVRTLSGHGGPIQDLAVSPKAPQLLASASSDTTIRIWHLGEDHKRKPCAAILASTEGHRLAPMSISFHSNGKWLLSGGMDTAWRVPSLPDENTGTDEPTMIEYPHFRSFEPHHEKVDCVSFYGDLIISKCCAGELLNNRILIWQIDGFSTSTDSPNVTSMADPSPLPNHVRSISYLPSPYTDEVIYPTKRSKDTWSAFGRGWTQLITLELPHSVPYWMRFSLLHVDSAPPLLAVGNEKGRAMFWDLQAIENGTKASRKRRRSVDDEVTEAEGSPRKKVKGRKEAVASQKKGTKSGTDAPVQASTAGEEGSGEGKKSIGGAFKGIPAHYSRPLPMHVQNRDWEVVYGTAWSPCGEWCIAAATYGRMYIFRR